MDLSRHREVISYRTILDSRRPRTGMVPNNQDVFCPRRRDKMSTERDRIFTMVSQRTFATGLRLFIFVSSRDQRSQSIDHTWCLTEKERKKHDRRRRKLTVIAGTRSVSRAREPICRGTERRNRRKSRFFHPRASFPL